MTDAETIPRAAHSGEFRIGALVLRCHVLDGRCIIEEESLAAFADWLASPYTTSEAIEQFGTAFGAWMRGGQARR